VCVCPGVLRDSEKVCVLCAVCCSLCVVCLLLCGCEYVCGCEFVCGCEYVCGSEFRCGLERESVCAYVSALLTVFELKGTLRRCVVWWCCVMCFVYVWCVGPSVDLG